MNLRRFFSRFAPTPSGASPEPLVGEADFIHRRHVITVGGLVGSAAAFAADPAGAPIADNAARSLGPVPNVGARADIAVFSADEFGERGTMFEPSQLARGMRHVVVNGVTTLSDGALTGARAGQVLRKR